MSDSVEGQNNGQKTTVDVDLNTYQVLFGLGYRFQ